MLTYIRMIKFSVVIPVYNEEGSILPLYSSLKNAMDAMKLEPYEVIFVNDGSQDASFERMNGIDSKPADLVIVDLAGHSGKSSALQAGFDAARGGVIITLDADLQNDPADIPKLLDKLNEGYDAVCGWRRKRNDPPIRAVTSWAARFLRQAVTGDRIRDAACSLMVFKRTVLKDIYLWGGMHRFFKLILCRLGYKVVEVEVRHHPRRFGRSKYGILDRLLEGSADLMRFLVFGPRKLMKREGASYQIREVIKR